MTAPVDDVVVIGEVVFERGNARLRVDGEVRALRPKAQAVLETLLGRPGSIVTKRELLDAVWPDVTVGDAVLKTCVRELREVLGDDSRAPRFIETVHRRGYRFLVTPERAAAPPDATSSAPARSLARGPTALVGRDAARAVLAASFAEADAGARRFAFLSGDAGIGKSTLLDAFLDDVAAHDGVWIARGPSVEPFAAGEPYRPMLTALGEWARHDAMRDELVSTLRRVAPTWLDAMPGLQTDADRERLAGEVLGATTERMVREMADALEVLASERTVVLAFDDVHWADDATVELLSVLASRRAPARLLVVLAQRPVDVIVRGHPARRLQRDVVARGVGRDIALELLSEVDVEGWLERRLGAPPPEHFARWLFEHTDGHPLFLVHVVDWLLERGWLAVRDGRWHAVDHAQRTGAVPDGLRALIETTAARWPDADRELLAAAAVAGTRFPSAAVAAALDMPVDDVEAAADALCERGAWLVAEGSHALPDGSLTARYRFAHTLVRQVLLEGIATTRRARWHHRIAKRGVEVYGESADTIACELAEHFGEAGATAAAVEYTRVAARTCVRRHAHRDALAHLIRARSLVEELDESEALEVALCDEIGRAARAAGELGTSAEAFEDGEAIARAAGDVPGAVHAALLAASARSWFDGDGCLAAVDRARHAAREGTVDARLAAHVEGSAAYWRLMWNGPSADLVDVGERCAEAMAAGGDDELTSQHLVRLALFRIGAADWRGAVDAAERGRRLARRHGDAFDDLVARWFIGWAELHGGDPSTAERGVAAARADALRNGHAPWVLLFDLLLAGVAVARGEDVTAELADLHARAVTLGHEFGRGFAEMLVARAAGEGFEGPRDVLMGWLLETAPG